ncbi:hypothetical protein [Candidatus Frankia alpina]|uniref:hypothetical protein n=1 Tax=Candidatus Frankia alpina TaxID=2699483 RepID=UPI001F39E5EC|nr:hypothetical protein [Candidatus Frankia alpina]
MGRGHRPVRRRRQPGQRRRRPVRGVHRPARRARPDRRRGRRRPGARLGPARPYLPCQHYDPLARTGDTFVNACYATYTRFPAGGGLVFPNGYFMGNAQPDRVRGGGLPTG